ncbi:nagb/rpia/CoA transferase-like protein [Meredithblackwellia eburnea MCA 4105]
MQQQSTIPDGIQKPSTQRKIDSLQLKLRRRQLIGSRPVALEVVKLFKEVVAGAKVSSFDALINHIEHVGKLLQDAGPKELVITNMTRRIHKFLSEEYATALNNFLNESHSGLSSPTTPHSVPATPAIGGSSSDPFLSAGRRESALGSMFDLLGHRAASSSSNSLDLGPLAAVATAATAPSASGFATPLINSSSSLSSPPSSVPNSPTPHSPVSSGHQQRPPLALRTPSTNILSPGVTTMLEEEFSRKSHTLKPVFIEAIQELLDEVEMTYRNVGELAVDHIHSGEFILTIGQSKTVEAFLKAASRKRKFTVIVAETAPGFSGRATAHSLSLAGITTILIPDSNIFSLLPRCSKVLLGPHLVLADGALLSISGSLPLCLAASKLRVPVVVCGGMFKFTPIYVGEEVGWSMRDLKSPSGVLRDQLVDEGEEETEVLNPYYDVVPAELVSLYITNLGGHPSSLLYRLLSDMYGST